ncbi:MAG TPA: hypothetical protein VIN07_06650 [Flavipsychrobacter sp.]
MLSLELKKPINVSYPPVYRYMNKQYVDDFFNNGRIRLSSYKKFRTYPDEIRGDLNEGSGTYLTPTQEGSQFMLMTQLGKQEYMLCGSLLFSEKIQTIFDTDACIKINSPIEFAASILNCLQGSTQAYLGACRYQSNRLIKKAIADFSSIDFIGPEGTVILGGPKMNENMATIIGNGFDILYLKEDKYIDQSEFRFVWSINQQYYKMYEYIDIECKEAIQFCERI